MMKTVNDLFILDGIKEGNVIAGHRGLNRSVQSVNISDTPDIIQFLNEGDILLTTGYAFEGDPQKLCDLITKMSSMNCAGMIIKLERFIIQLPEEVKLLADDLSFPIIDLPLSYTLGEVSHYILNYLNNHKIEQLYYAMYVHKKFSNMMIKGYDLPSLIEQLRYLLKRPALLFNHRAETLAASHDFRDEAMKPYQTEMTEKIKEDLPAARHGATLYLASQDQPVTTFPVQTRRLHDSILVIADADTLPYPASQQAIEQASNVLSFTLVKQQALEENARLYKVNFFSDLIEGRIHSQEEIEVRCEYYGIEPNRDTLCIICRADDERKKRSALNEREVEEMHNNIYDVLDDQLIHRQLQGTLFTRDKFIVLIMQFNDYNGDEAARLQCFLQKIQQSLQQMDFAVSFGVSNQIESPKDIPTAYREAEEAINNGYELNLTTFIKFYKARELKELLTMIPGKNLKEFYQNTLKSLAYPETKEDQELLKTLQVYLDYQCEISETSRKMFVHRNTVKYRIEKAEKLLGSELRDPADSLRIRTALLIRPVLDV